MNITLIDENKDESVKTHEQGGLDILYQEELRVHLDCKKYLSENEIKTYSPIISNYCTKLMRTRIEEHPDYDTKIINNPFIHSLIILMSLDFLFAVSFHSPGAVLERNQINLLVFHTNIKSQTARAAAHHTPRSGPKTWILIGDQKSGHDTT